MTADNEGAIARPAWKKKRWRFLAFVLALGFGLHQFDSGLNHLFGSIIGRSSIGTSDSMEPYELVFRTQWSTAEHKKVPRKEWVLNIPRAFLTDMTGSNGGTAPDADFFANLEVVFDPQTGQFTPIALAERSKLKDFAINVGLENRGGLALLIPLNSEKRRPQELDLTNLCVRDDDIAEFSERFGLKDRDRVCGKEWARCTIHTHLDGWGIRLSTPQALYADPQPICDAMKSFLQEHTTKRDSLLEQR